MAKKGFKQPARDTRPNVKMGDLMEWVDQIEEEHGKLVQLVMHPAGHNPDRNWSLACMALEPTVSSVLPIVDEVRIRWPNNRHSTVLGAFLWLLMTLEQQLAASAALDALSAPSE